MKTFLTILSLLLSITITQASDNKDLWICDPDVLSDEQLCLFIRTDEVTAGPHNMDKRVAAEGKRAVVSSQGKQKAVQGQPMDVCDVLEAVDTEVTGNDLAYVRVFEMMAPIQDYAMFAPNDLGIWDQLTQVLADCGVKDESNGEVGSAAIISFDDVLVTMENAVGDPKNTILQFLEEAALELLCIMADTGTWDKGGHCDDFRLDHGLAEGQSSDCWEDYYYSMPDYFTPNFHKNVGPNNCIPVPTSDGVVEYSEQSETEVESETEVVSETESETEETSGTSTEDILCSQNY